jgi:hypothetical protein
MRFLVLGDEIPVAEPVRFTSVGMGTGRAPPPRSQTSRRSGVGRAATPSPGSAVAFHQSDIRVGLTALPRERLHASTTAGGESCG